MNAFSYEFVVHFSDKTWKYAWIFHLARSPFLASHYS